MLKAAIMGLGRWGQRLVASVQDPAERASSVIRFVRGATRTPSKAAEFAVRHNLPVGSELQSILDDPEVQAIVLATPHSQHAEQIIAAARAGKHVFVEKPITLSSSDAERAAAACHAAGSPVGSGA